LFAGLPGRTPDSGALAVNHAADRVAEVAQQGPATCNLDRIRRTLPHAVRMGAGPAANASRFGAVACDGLDA